MIQSIIWLVVAIILFCIVAYGLKWVITAFELPKPVLWICGGLLLIVILLWLTGQLPGPIPPFKLRD